MPGENFLKKAEKIKNIKKFEKVFFDAVNKNKNIVLYSDSDPDGACCAVILKEALELLGRKPKKVYFPDREKEGYGLNFRAIEKLKKYAPGLLIVTDCGTTSVQEVELAKKYGFEVAIIDHHVVFSKTPRAIFINLHQKGDKFYFKELCAAGLVYVIVKYLFLKNKISFSPESFLELAMLATIADRVPLVSLNKEIVEQGIEALKITKRPALKVLKNKTKLRQYTLDKINYKIVHVLGAGYNERNINKTYKFLIERNDEKLNKMSDELTHSLQVKYYEIQRIVDEVEERLKVKGINEFIFEGSHDWQLFYLGPAASRLIEKYKVPVFLYHILKDVKEAVGAVRSTDKIDSVKAMQNCKKYLLLYGGHPKASGFRIKIENLSDFYYCLLNYIKKNK
ncbi:Single-stranded-DNA-specific exonuclease RecJ [bacterium HR34]|nr:Single-stranded-DNA-specific exonuclease RecJ [bacterium HR34]